MSWESLIPRPFGGGGMDLSEIGDCFWDDYTFPVRAHRVLVE